jgi:hypothetical protein
MGAAIIATGEPDRDGTLAIVQQEAGAGAGVSSLG